MFESNVNRRTKQRGERNGVNYSNLLNIQIDTSNVCGKRASTIQSLSEETLGQGNRPKSFQRSKILMAHLNIRSLKNRDHLVQLQMLTSEKGFDVLATLESWLNSTVSNAEIEISGYKLFRQDRERKKGGSVCVYIRTSLKAKVLKELCAISDSGFQQFVEFFCYALFTDLQTVLCPALVTILWKTTCMLLPFGKEVFVTGDLNCNMLSDCSEAHSLSDLCDSLNLTQLIKTPTRVTSQSSSLIDVILASDASLVVDSGVEETYIGNNLLVHSKLELKRPKPEPTYITCRGYKHYHTHDFVEDLFQFPWYENSLIGDANEKVEHFNANFGSVLDRHAPIKIMKIRYQQCPFRNQEIKHQMRIRDELHKIARATKLPVDWNKFSLPAT